jgi:TolB protein
LKNASASALIVLTLSGVASCQPAGGNPHAAGPVEVLDWKSLETPMLSGHVQLTHRDRFLKAGEAYFNGDASWVVFQAVPVPEAGKDAAPFYSMYVAKVNRGDAGTITGLGTPILVSPPGSANTCGWFHPKQPGLVIFGSTIDPPATDQKGGFQVGTRSYVWLFPEEMEIVAKGVGPMFAYAKYGKYEDGKETVAKGLPEKIFSRPNYDAECSFSKDGRYLLYANVREEKTQGRPDADLWIYDTKTEKQIPLVTADGYDGGPFFSPDGKRICYRSDRKLNDHLQLFIADLAFDEDGVPAGISKEYQITDNDAVNWAPFWHPSGKFIVYGTSEVGHHNYEVFAIEIDDAKLALARPAEALRRARITQASGADILPVFSGDGKHMMWTAQRGPMIEGEQRPSSQLWVAEFDPSKLKFD